MARLNLLPLLLLVALLWACDELVGFDDPITPLVRLQIKVEGSSSGDGGEAGAPVQLRAALVWAAQWLPEPFCFLPPESPAAASVIVAGCRHSLSFAPSRVAANAAVSATGTATLQLFNVPSGDTMVGDVTARVAYASLVIYDDRNGNGTLELQRTRHRDRGGSSSGDAGPADAGVDLGPEDLGSPSQRDAVLGASFVTMAQPDQRFAFREGAFNDSAAFYPRNGCAAPPRGFSLISAGGFSLLEAQLAALTGKLPRIDPATCATAAPSETVVTIKLQSPEALQDVGCTIGRGQHYHEPPRDEPDFTGRAWACTGLPSLGKPASSKVQQLVLAGRPGQPCKSLAYYTLRGCDNDPECKNPEWDRSANPPSWWPCKNSP